MEISALGVLICKRAQQLYRLDLPSSRAEETEERQTHRAPSRQTVTWRKCNREHLAITILVGSSVLAPILSGKIPTQHSSNENLAGLLADWLSHQGPLPKVPLPLHQSQSALMPLLSMAKRKNK